MIKFGFEFPHLPTNLPEDLYVKPKDAKEVKSNRKKLKLVCSPDLQKVIRSIAALLPREIFVDPFVLAADRSDLLALSDMSRNDPLVKRWFSGEFNVIPVKEGLELWRVVNGESKMIFPCEGQGASSGQLFEYIMRYCDKALPAFVNLHRLGFVCHGGKVGSFCDKLKSFRVTRRCSPGLNRISKLDELNKIDQDSTFFKFPVLDHWLGNDTVWHLGSGKSHSTSQRALYAYDRVVLIDPILDSEGPDHWKKTWQAVLREIPPEVDVVSDVAYGDDLGMVDDGMVELVQELYSLCADRLVMVKLSLGGIYGHVRGFCVSKVRPHNAEAVFVLDPSAGLIDNKIEVMREAVLSANEERNDKIYRQEFSDEVKDVAISSQMLGTLMRLTPPTLPVCKREYVPRSDRMEIYCRDMGIAHLGKRFFEWREVCHDPNVGEGPYAILPTSYHLDRGPLLNFDPGLNCPLISLRTVLETGKLRGLKVMFRQGQWFFE